MAMLNTACAGKFSSDRTIEQYAKEIWHLEKVKVSMPKKEGSVVTKKKTTK